MFKIKFIGFLLSVFLQAIAAQDFFDSGLGHGKYKVGFSIVKTVDYSRPSLNNQPVDGKAPKGREMQFHIWYPAASVKTGPMQYKEYITLLVPAKEEKAQALRNAFFRNITELSGDTSLFTHVYQKIINSKTRSHKNSVAAKGIFPLIIYPDNAHLQSILCEYLASHGYIIVSPVIKGTWSAPMEYSPQGIETGIADMQFALGYIRSHFNVKQDFSLMGTGFNATLALGMQMRNNDAKAVVSLEGGITTGFEEALIQRTPYFDLQHCKGSMLIIHSPHPDVKPALTYKYKYAERIYQHYPQSSEFYFLNYGIWERHLKNIFPKANKGNTWQSFLLAAGSVHHYLNWKLNKDSVSKDILFNGGWPADFVQSSFIAANALPPSPEELVKRITVEGMDTILNLYNERKRSDPQPFPFSTFYQVGLQLVQQAAYAQLLSWSKLYSDSYAYSALPYSMLGRAQLELGNKTEAKTNYEKALALLPADAELGEGEKSFFRAAIEDRLRAFN